MSNKCPKCGEELEDLATKRLKSIMRNMTLANRLGDYILSGIDQKDWHPEVREFSYNNLITNKL